MRPWLDRLASARLPGWAYDAGLVAFALVTLAASWFLVPGADNRWVYLPNGARFGETCLILDLTGAPCPQCGMTRAFLHAARGELTTSFLRNPGGLALFLWIQVGGLIGGVRLLVGRARQWELPHNVFLAWVLFWFVGLYVVPYALRLGGINPLP